MHRTVVPPERIIELRDWAWRSVNTDEHIATRLSQSSGVRWEAGRANIVKQNSVA